MAIVETDITVDNTTKVIDYVGAAHGVAGAGYYTGIELHRWLGDLADDATADPSSLDFMDMTKLTPSSRNGIDQIIEMLNGYTLTVDMIEHLYDCSVIMGGGEAQQFADLVAIGKIFGGAFLQHTTEFIPELLVLLGIVLHHAFEHAQHLFHRTTANAVDDLATLQDFTRYVQRQVVGIDQPADETQVARHQLLRVFHDENPLHVELDTVA